MKTTPPESSQELRQRAEVRYKTHLPEASKTPSSGEPEQLLYELQIHQIELEMQNEELRRYQEELEASKSKYFDLYDLAPVGYLTINKKGLIQQANLTAATMLGVSRALLLQNLMTQFIISEDHGIYYRHNTQLFENNEPQSCELRMLKKSGTVFWARLESTAAKDADGAPTCRLIISNLAERKNAELHIEQQLVFAKALSEIAETIISNELRVYAVCSVSGTTA